ncbi:MAG: prohibitin family protein [Chitinophagaceae bacterium]|jgi:regulator of protease activity HflC (stomatin/prohibitin superfamily)|nr:prohibitin family protein [Chitinophagaceae bacterium]
MFLIILGVLLFVLSSHLPVQLIRLQDPIKIKKSVRLAGISLLILGVFTSCVKQIDTGYVGVQALFGKIQSTVLNSGLNIINPLVDVKDVDVRTQNYTMSGIHDEGERSGDDAIRVLTRDGLEVTIDLSVLYRVNAGNAPKLIQMVGVEFKDKIIRPVTRTKIRDNAVYYDAVELYSTKRDEFQTRIFKGIDDEFNKRGLILENLLVRNISLPQTVKLTIESKINAEQDAQKMQFVLQKEKQEAERKRVEAQGIADYQRIISEGLTEKQLRYEQIKAYKEIASSTNTKVIIMPDKGSNFILDTK